MRALIARLRGLASRLRTLFARDAVDSELAEEMRFHRDMLARDLAHEGKSARDAEHGASVAFGNALALRERSIDTLGFPSLEQIAQDVRYGARMLGRNPGFAVVGIGAIGLAIGINAGFFTLVDAFTWQPIPVARPDGLVKLMNVDSRGGSGIRFSYAEFQTIAKNSRALTDVDAYDAVAVAIRVSSSSRAVAASAAVVSGNYFSVLDGVPAVGRLLAPGDDADGAAPVVVISDGMWARSFNRASDIVGRDIVINGMHATLVGVARADFVGINPLVPDLWITARAGSAAGITPGNLLDAGNRFLTLHARLAPGVGRARAEAELSTIIAEPLAASGSRHDLSRIIGGRLMPNSSALPSDSQTALMVAPALLVVALVLLIACANLANLLLARALVRHREIAVRLALGASRTRLIRQLLTESFLIAAAGAALGLLLANWTVTLTSRSFFSMIPSTYGTLALHVHASWRVVAYTVGLTVASVAMFGLAPALQGTFPNLTAALKGEDTLFGTRLRRSRIRDSLIAVQVAAAVVLLVASGILAKSVASFVKEATGLEPSHVSVATLGLSAEGHVTPRLAHDRDAFDVRVSHLPHVVTARAQQPPFMSWPVVHVAAIDDRGPTSGIFTNRITPRYFDVVGQRLVEGRAFVDADSAGDAPVAIVTERAARHIWSTGSAVGRSIRIVSSKDENDRIVRIVGVVADASSAMLWDNDRNGFFYLPATSADFATFDMPMLVLGAQPPSEFARQLGDIAMEIDRDAPLHVDPLASVRELQIVPYRYGAAITSGVAAIGLGLALIGLYGVVAFSVRQRQRDVAVHIAMGAKRVDILRLILRRELRLVLIGLGIGVIAAAGESQLIGALTLSLAPLGVSEFIAIAGALLAVAAVAAIVPALRALRVAPMHVLRQE